MPVSNVNKVKTYEWEGIIMRQLYDGKVDKKNERGHISYKEKFRELA
jgi:hypothetical protein